MDPQIKMIIYTCMLIASVVVIIDAVMSFVVLCRHHRIFRGSGATIYLVWGAASSLSMLTIGGFMLAFTAVMLLGLVS